MYVAVFLWFSTFSRCETTYSTLTAINTSSSEKQTLKSLDSILGTLAAVSCLVQIYFFSHWSSNDRAFAKGALLFLLTISEAGLASGLTYLVRPRNGRPGNVDDFVSKSMHWALGEKVVEDISYCWESGANGVVNLVLAASVVDVVFKGAVVAFSLWLFSSRWRLPNRYAPVVQMNNGNNNKNNNKKAFSRRVTYPMGAIPSTHTGYLASLYSKHSEARPLEYPGLENQVVCCLLIVLLSTC